MAEMGLSIEHPREPYERLGIDLHSNPPDEVIGAIREHYPRAVLVFKRSYFAQPEDGGDGVVFIYDIYRDRFAWVMREEETGGSCYVGWVGAYSNVDHHELVTTFLDNWQHAHTGHISR